MIENILDIDFAMRLASMKDGRALAVFFDFEAAFPSISWDFVLYILRIIKTPKALIRALRRLYNRNEQTVKLDPRLATRSWLLAVFVNVARFRICYSLSVLMSFLVVFLTNLSRVP